MRILISIIALNIATQLAALSQVKPALIPFPTSWATMEGSFSFNKDTRIFYSEYCANEVSLFVEWLNTATSESYKCEPTDGATMPAQNMIIFSCGADMDHEKSKQIVSQSPLRNRDTNTLRDAGEDYQLIINPRAVVINANEPHGVFQATQTLRQLFPRATEKQKLQLPLNMECMQIRDEPRFSHRGMLLDCCRHFMSVDFVKRYIDLLAFYKMNVLHWHLTEDQGWRIQIDKYPLLTEVGAWRTEKDGTRYGGFYSKEDIRGIVAYAKARHITVIPEIELPGHSSAAIASYPSLSCTGEKIKVENEWGVFKDIYCAGNDETFRFLEDVLAEVCELFPSTYIHIGGDEAPHYRWQQCDKCQQRMKDESLASEAELQTYFIERIAKFLETKGKKIIGWDEILEGGIPSSAAIQSWRGMEGGVHAVTAKHQVVMSPTSHCYFDYGLQSIDLEKVYLFDPIPAGLDMHSAAYIMGAECNMWTEHAPQEKVDGKIFPRMLALSEVLWSYPEKRDYHEFYSRIETHYEILDAMKVNYGFPSVPVEINAHVTDDQKIRLELKSEIPGLSFTYQTRLLPFPEVIQNDMEIPHPWSKAMKYETPFDMVGLSEVKITPEWNGKLHEEEIVNAQFWAHAGAAKNLKLSYEPSPNYTGGGNFALVDGRLGSLNFRDGNWQALQGRDMEAVIDFGLQQPISSVSTNWYHYGNAWIFRPSKVEFFVSDDGKTWTSIAMVNAPIEERHTEQAIMPYSASFETVEARFLKMVAVNNGPCPAWHDAAGEPSWLFCDEWVVR
ncbi:MAG: family 20 glycosylhydrolase [Flavobacteriales bacterium]|nr:family 20 glycosylhydrolase [Flavobacteriales bacterium]